MPAEKRFVFSARFIGAMHRETPKLKMFMISVLWSDENEVIIYRSYNDFKNFHKQLKKKFPVFDPSQNNSRMIPKFKGEAQKKGIQQSGSKRSIERMKDLQGYCDKLLMCHEMVTRSSEVTQFFTPLDQDMVPEFTKNCVMILLPDDSSARGREGERGGGSVWDGGLGSVTPPFVTETYRCVAPYETKDTKNRPFKVAKDETLEVLIKDPTGWWLVENEDKCIAWFPAPYLEKEENDMRGLQQQGAFYLAVRNYFAKKADEVSLPIGSVVEVLRMSDDGWWLTRFNDKVGYVPSMYLQPYNNPCTGLLSLQKKMNRSTLNLTISGLPLDASSPAQLARETHLGQSFALQPGAQSSGRGCLDKARSMELLSETQTVPAQVEINYSRLKSRVRSISTSSSIDTSISSVSSSSSTSRRNSSASYMSSGSSESFSSRGSDTGPVPPTVPPRPKKEEILNRCSSVTRKAALESKTQLQRWPDSTIHSRL
ncbi:NADPH oxidase organizer 1-like [Hippocampus zosterae]|uniref:NADPH oxidase organizer 1-like n=1 Tax=Hippocampus zosterae TaxID=109293 RepID=UPI00223E2B05|nr:NADPH oxidase organizer 1-like [Hippocampus zosterae]